MDKTWPGYYYVVKLRWLAWLHDMRNNDIPRLFFKYIGRLVRARKKKLRRNFYLKFNTLLVNSVNIESAGSNSNVKFTKLELNLLKLRISVAEIK